MAVVILDSNNFKEEVLDAKGKVFVDFYADWCGPCRMMGPVVEELAEELKDVKICKINVDSAEDIARNYDVMSIPTFILFEDGNIKNKIVGGRSKEEMAEWIRG